TASRAMRGPTSWTCGRGWRSSDARHAWNTAVRPTHPSLSKEPETTVSQTVDFFFDVGSSAAYLAWTQLPRLRTDTAAQIVHKPMLLVAVFQAIGNRSPAEVKAKGDYMLQDFGRFAQRYGVPFAFNPHFPVNTLTLMRG